MVVEKIPVYFRLLDYLMIPLMWIAGKCMSDSIQETHIWHLQKFSCPLVPEKVCLPLIGNETSWAQEKHKILVHIPLLGGWTKYAVLEAIGFKSYWHVGWRVQYTNGRKERCEIQKLKMYTNRVRILIGQNDSRKLFFGLDERGNVIQIKKVGEGTLGDNRFAHVRLV